MKTAHYWTEPHPSLSLCVSPPIEAGGRWQRWVRTLSAKDREFVQCEGQSGGYWKINQDLFQSFNRLCIESSWILERGRPLGIRRKRRQHQGQDTGHKEPPPAAPIKQPPFEALFITPNAPKFVATAAFNALAKKYHPDKHSGTSQESEMKEKMQAITNAKSEIWKAKGW